MVEFIGIALLIYGIIGLIGALVMYWWWARPQGPLQNLHKQLTHLANLMQESVLLTRRANELAPKISDIS